MTTNLKSVEAKGSVPQTVRRFAAMSGIALGAALGSCAPSVAVQETPNAGNFIVHAVEPFSEMKVIGDEWPVPGARTGTLRAVAARGEVVSASFVLRAVDRDYPALTLQAGPAVSVAGAPFLGTIDLRVVKVWFQGGTAGRSIRADATPTLVPELLLHDDALVTVDAASRSNSLRCETKDGIRYLSISDPAPRHGRAVYPGRECIVRDADALLPVRLRAHTHRQFWITAEVPVSQEPGIYRTTLRMTEAEKPLGEFHFDIEVLPFVLADSPLTYSLYYRAVLDPAGGISSDVKNETQMRADLINMRRHGIRNPTVYQPVEDRANIERVLRLRNETGFGNQPLYFLGLRTEQTHGADVARRYVEKYRALKQLAGSDVTELYVYGIDEADPDALAHQRPIWRALRDSGARIFTAGWRPGYFDAAGDMLDLFVDGRPFSHETPRQFHQLGHAAFKYNTPQSGIENPALYRLNYGIRLWRHGYDGAMIYTYQDGFGTVWNDFDSPRFRDHNFTYPTSVSAVDTLAWEGLREGINDVRYIATLQARIAANRAAPDGERSAAATNATRYLDALANAADTTPAQARHEIVRHILNLAGAPAVVALDSPRSDRTP